MSPPRPLTHEEELARMVITLADVKASMPRKLRGVISREYGVNVQADKVFGAISYTAGSGKLMPDFRFTLKAGRQVLLRSYNPGDWELAVKRAHDDLVAQSGAFEGLSIKLPEPTSDVGKKGRPPGNTQPQKKKGFLGRLLGLFIETGR